MGLAASSVFIKADIDGFDNIAAQLQVIVSACGLETISEGELPMVTRNSLLQLKYQTGSFVIASADIISLQTSSDPTCPIITRRLVDSD